MAEYPLERAWTVWRSDKIKKPKHGGRDVSTSGEDSFTPPQKQGEFANIETYWRTIGAIPRPSLLQVVDTNYYVFAAGVTPSWEDPANRNGGRWTFAIDNKTIRDADSAWLQTHLALVGETLDPAFDVVGISLTCRRFYTRVSVWTRDREATKAVMTIGCRLKALAHVPKVEYQDHGAAFEAYRHVV